jgi:polyphosphate kinase
VIFPIEDEKLRKEIVEEILEVQLRDTAKGHLLMPDGSYVPVASMLPADEPLLNSQLWFLNGRSPEPQPAPRLDIAPV